MRTVPIRRVVAALVAGWLGVAGAASFAACSNGPVDPDGDAKPLTQAGRDSVFVAQLRAQLDAAMAAGQFSGVVLVRHDGYTLFEEAYGLADRELKVPNTPLTRFRLGSMNKMITAVSVMQLVQAGKLQLDKTLGTYIPDYPNAEMASKVTLHHLLTHTGGTGDIFGAEFMAHRSELRTVDDYVELYGARDLLFTPGTKWQYSNYGFILLGALIERVSGISYYDYVATNVYAPAGMTATGSEPEETSVPGRSVGYTHQSGSLVSNAPLLPWRGTPAGGGYSTAADMARFAAAVRENRLLSAENTALLLSGKVDLGPQLQYAYGFDDRVVAGRRFVGHPGEAAGMSAQLEFEPGGGYVVVVLSNFDPPIARDITTFILDRLPSRTP